LTFLADESVDRQIVEAVRRNGHKIVAVAETSAGIPDMQVLNWASGAGAILLTADKDFGELVFRQQRVHSGVMLIRLHGQEPQTKAEIVAAAIEKHGDELVFRFSVVTSKAVRIRRVQN
jgi:predicted nuclease of predicted toxin-antitoxin system